MGRDTYPVKHHEKNIFRERTTSQKRNGSPNGWKMTRIERSCLLKRLPQRREPPLHLQLLPPPTPPLLFPVFTSLDSSSTRSRRLRFRIKFPRSFRTILVEFGSGILHDCVPETIESEPRSYERKSRLNCH